MNEEIYQCSKCGGVYKRTNSNTSCCVMHGPESCCHFTDIKINDIDAFRDFAEKEKKKKEH